MYVTAKLIGGLANRIFVIHAATYYAKKTNRKFVLIPEFVHTNTHESKQHTESALKEIFGPFVYNNFNTANWRTITDPEQNAFYYKTLPLYSGESVIFDGYFQNPQYFSPKPNKPITKEKLNCYFIHIRLGDYLNFDLYKIPLKAYYSEAIIQIIENDIDAKFLIFSNDNKGAEHFIKENIKVPFDYIFSSAESALDTLKQMAACKGAICTNSSLSWMGAYYQSSPRKNIYMPNPWTNSKKICTIYPEWSNVIKL